MWYHFKLKHLRLQLLLVLLMTQPFFVKFVKIWKKDPLVIVIQNQLRSHQQVHGFLVIMLCSSFKMVYFMVMVFCIFLMALCDFKFSRLSMMFWLHVILNSTRPWSSCLKITSGHNFGKMWSSLLDLAMFVFEQRILVIAFIISFNHCWSLHPHGFQFPWISS
jgi:hypothetical protein